MRKFAFVFPGQSSQRKGMMAELYVESPIVRDTFMEASEVMQMDVAEICFTGTKQVLQDISINASLILTAGVASFRHILQEYKLYPSILAGHSLGEYSALVCSGILSFADALKLVTERSDLAKNVMIKRNAGMTVVYNCQSTIVEEICRQMRKDGAKAWIACYNSPTQVSVSGDIRDLKRLEKLVKKAGGLSKHIVGNAPYHSPLMLDALTEFEFILKKYSIHSLAYPVLSNYKIAPYTEDTLVENLTLQLTNPVYWKEIIYYIARQNIDTVIELGSGNILTNLMTASSNDLQVVSYEKSGKQKKLFSEWEKERVVKG